MSKYINKQIEIMKKHKSFRQSELDFILKRYEGRELMLRLIELENRFFDKDNQDILRGRRLK